MRKNVSKVVEAFLAGKACSTPSVNTNGSTVFSYAMPIARRVEDGSVNVLTGRGPTVTTSQHLGQVRALLAMREGLKVQEVDANDL